MIRGGGEVGAGQGEVWLPSDRVLHPPKLGGDLGFTVRLSLLTGWL